MANSAFIPLQGCQKSADERQTIFAAGSFRLFQGSLVPTPSTTDAEYAAAEADYDTYAPIVVAAWFEPMLAPTSGYSIASEAVQFDVGVADPVTPNSIGGAGYEDEAGVARLAAIFDPALPMQMAGQAIPLQFFDFFPTGL